MLKVAKALLTCSVLIQHHLLLWENASSPDLWSQSKCFPEYINYCKNYICQHRLKGNAIQIFTSIMPSQSVTFPDDRLLNICLYFVSRALNDRYTVCLINIGIHGSPSTLLLFQWTHNKWLWLPLSHCISGFVIINCLSEANQMAVGLL